MTFGYDLGEEGSGDVISVSPGFETDFASIPRVLWWLLPKWGKYGNAAVIHDYLYSGGSLMAKGTALVSMDRKLADYILLEAMEVMNTPRWQKYLIYAGVRAGGWWGWRKRH